MSTSSVSGADEYMMQANLFSGAGSMIPNPQPPQASKRKAGGPNVAGVYGNTKGGKYQSIHQVDSTNF
jgi:hypothetical protein